MRDTVLTLLAIAFLLLAAAEAVAGGPSPYAGPDGASRGENHQATFVMEHGLMQGANLEKKDQSVERVLLRGLLEVLAGRVDLDALDLSGNVARRRDNSHLGAWDEVTIDGGNDVSASILLKRDSSLVGTRKELSAGVKLPAAPGLSLEPFAGLGHKYWVSSSLSEDWSILYAKAGVGFELKTKQSTIFARGGGLLPVHARVHTSPSAAGAAEQVATPQSELGAFAEGGVRMGHFTFSVEYEGMKFGQPSSGMAASGGASISGVSSLAGLQNGPAGGGGTGYQPEANSSLLFFKVTYGF